MAYGRKIRKRKSLNRRKYGIRSSIEGMRKRIWNVFNFLNCQKESVFMRYEWIDEYLLGKAGVSKDLQKDWNWIRYQIGGKMFAAVCLGENDEPYYITLKLEPMEGDFLRQQYEDIIPGYYMNKTHWNSVKPDGNVPDDLLKDLLDKSYQLVLGSFSKKKQREILNGEHSSGTVSCCGTD